MLVDELRELTNNSKQYQEEYEEIVDRLKGAALNGLNKTIIIDMSDEVRSRLEGEGLTVIHKCELASGQPISYDLIEW